MISDFWFAVKTVVTRKRQIFFILWIVPVFNNILHYTCKKFMNTFGPIRAKVKFTPKFYYKNYNNKTYKILFTIYDDKKIRADG